MGMKRFLFICCLALAAVFCGSGCADPVVFGEVFQLKKGQKLYTKYNIWYTDPAKISCLNIQEGTFLPLGTEIEPVGTDGWKNTITFRDKQGQQYSIVFDPGLRLCAMQDFIAYTFTTSTREEMLKGIPAANQKRLLRGEVVPGMNQAQVILAYGPPPAVRTPDRRNESWIYWISESATVRVVFRGDVVAHLLNVNLR